MLGLRTHPNQQIVTDDPETIPLVSTQDGQHRTNWPSAGRLTVVSVVAHNALQMRPPRYRCSLPPTDRVRTPRDRGRYEDREAHEANTTTDTRSTRRDDTATIGTPHLGACGNPIRRHRGSRLVATTVETPSDGVEIENLTKRFGRGSTATTAVEDLSFTVSPGRVTGFLGPNGAGKTTTLRCILGLVSATSGDTLISGHRYRDLKNPSTVVGATLESTGFNPGRTARNHLRIRATAIDADPGSVAELLEFVGLDGFGNRRVGAYSLGMRQRLGLAMALIGRPSVLILDEPGNGLDPAGIAWLRTFLKQFAADGGTVLMSSHLLSEVRQSVDDVVIIDNGHLVRASSLESLLAESGCRSVTVTGPDLTDLTRAVVEGGGTAIPVDRPENTGDAQEITICRMRANEVGHLAHLLRTELHLLTETESDLEQLFLEITTGETPEITEGKA